MTDHGYGGWIEDRDQEAAAKAGMTLSDWRAARQHEKRMARGHALLLKHKADEADIAYYRQHETPADEHPDDIAVDRFAAAMKAKLAKKRADGRGGWQDKDGFPAAVLGSMLREHVEKGDPVDVANFCMMAHQRGEAIAAAKEGEDRLIALLHEVIQHEHSSFWGTDAEKHKRAQWRGIRRKIKAALAKGGA